MSEGTASAQRINNSLTGDPLLLHRVDASQLEAPVHVVPGRIEENADDEYGEPVTWRCIVGLLLMGLASWGVVGLAFYCAVKLAEAVR